jgi:putative sigma-54 modulation protein
VPLPSDKINALFNKRSVNIHLFPLERKSGHREWYDNGVKRIDYKKVAMDVIIQSLGFKASDELEAYIREKLEKLTPAERIVRANVILYLGPDRATANNYCEIRLEVPGNDLFIKESNPDFEQAVDEAVNKLQGMWRKAKEKEVDRQQGKVNE